VQRTPLAAVYVKAGAAWLMRARLTADLLIFRRYLFANFSPLSRDFRASRIPLNILSTSGLTKKGQPGAQASSRSMA
jgi:hypothetical protein